MSRLLATLVLAFALHLVEAQPLKVAINPAEQKQTIEYFAAADAWSGDFVGK